MLVESGDTGVQGVGLLDMVVCTVGMVGGGVVVDKHGFDGVDHGGMDDGPELYVITQGYEEV